jgi:hypothetical protein
MPLQVCMGASLQCSFGAAPSALIVIPKGRPVMVSGMLAGTILDNIPIANILPFGMCSSIANPMVASATAAALGVLTPMPCIPVVVSPWTPGAVKVKIGSIPALPSTAICNCAYGGMIKINAPGQFKVNIT